MHFHPHNYSVLIQTEDVGMCQMNHSVVARPVIDLMFANGLGVNPVFRLYVARAFSGSMEPL